MDVHSVPNSDSLHLATALLVSSFEYDHIYFETLFSRTKWKLVRAHENGEALEMLRNHIIPVIILAEQIEPGGWKGMLEEVQQLLYTPRLIVASLLATNVIWADVLNMGAYDVLARPLEEQEILHSISMAWLSWKDSTEREVAPAGGRSGGKNFWPKRAHL